MPDNNGNNQNNNDDDEYEKYCYLCRRPESEAGPFIRMPGNMYICNDCMQKSFDSFNNGAMQFLDLSKMPNINMSQFMPFDDIPTSQKVKKKKKQKVKLTKVSFAAIMIGFTSSSTFMLWLNCNQELGKLYNLSDPSKIQSFYAVGTFAAILCSSVFIKKGLKEINILIIYPLISFIMLGLCYFIQNPTICLIGGFVIGFAGAGGVLQLAVSTTAEFFPENKGTATSMVMIASSVANYTILTLAGYITKTAGTSAPRMILLLNMAVTFIGILLALFVKMNRGKEA